jgi:glycosyltransferase involved in cell wall biosynthesis
MAVASVVIPAHNEAASIGRTLRALRTGLDGHELEVIVVCNGCSDNTAEIARGADPRARVIEIARPSKNEAVRVGNASTNVFPRVHLDADIELTGADLLRLVEPVAARRAMAVAPARSVPRTGCSRWVRWYYDVWEALPHVQTGLFGRGVVALSREAEARVEPLSGLMNDDLGLSDAFSPQERLVVTDAVAVVRPPRTVGDLVRRRARVATGNVQAQRLGARRQESRTSVSTLVRLVAVQPGLAFRLPVFLGVYLAASVIARKAVRVGDFQTWQRDESSRTD